MKQLSGLDAAFLYFETPNAPQHVAGLSIYDQSTAPGGKVRFKEIIDNFYKRICALPTMTSRVVKVPLSLDHPYWVCDGDFDPEFHIRHLALPRPGDWRQLCIMVSRLMARPLDLNRPLWEAYIIEGLDGVEGVKKGSFAMFTKVHHSLTDGSAGRELSAAFHDLTADYETVDEVPPVPAERVPTTWDMLFRTQVNLIRKPFNFLNVVFHTVPGLARVRALKKQGKLHESYQVPRTRFNATISPYRVFNAITFPLKDIKAMKDAIPGATVNDVAVALCGGALRKYLAHHRELPDESLVALVPINLRTEADASSGGNVVSFMRMRVRSDIKDPAMRLQAVHEGSLEAKEIADAIGAKSMTDYQQFIPSMLTSEAARLASNWGLANRIKPIFNCVITNVPGPQVPLYTTGAKMTANYGALPLIDGLGLMHVIGSYCGSFSISMTACREIVPDPDFYRQCLRESFEELKAGLVA